MPGTVLIWGDEVMDAERIEELERKSREAEFDGGMNLPWSEIDELVTAYKALQSIAEFPEAWPEGWRAKAEELKRYRRHGSRVAANVYERCANELQQALPDGMRNT